MGSSGIFRTLDPRNAIVRRWSRVDLGGMILQPIAWVVLVVIGMVALLWGGVFWTDRDTVIDAGPLQVTSEEREGVPVPPVYMMDDEKGINAFAAGYSPSDAVVGVTRTLAVELAAHNIRVNAVCIGLVKSGQIGRLVQ